MFLKNFKIKIRSERGVTNTEYAAIVLGVLGMAGQALWAVGQKSPISYAQVADCLHGGGTDIIIYADSLDICASGEAEPVVVFPLNGD